MPDADPRQPWWHSGVLYQIYTRSFADSNGDGVGDLVGIMSRLDYLADLGVDGIWLTPVTPSPNADWGYDVSDYCAVDPVLGSLSDLDDLVGACAERDMRVVLDIVPNHSSDQHAWFRDARTSRSARYRNYYVWADGKADGSPPNNWVSVFGGGPAWSLDPATSQYYLHNFLPEQPDLNWWEPGVHQAFEEILRFWFDRGVAGFRIDVCHGIVKDALLRDNPVSTEADLWVHQIFGQRPVYNANRPEVHDILRSWRRLADGYEPGRLLMGETNVEELSTLVSYYGTGTDELNLALNFVLIESGFEAESLRGVVDSTEALLPPGAWPVWTGSNHDISRLATRWAGGDRAKARLALLMLLTLRGTPVLYQGDELGLTDTTLEHADLRDPVGLRFWPAYAGRDPVRTPMPWSQDPGAGFTRPGVTPWLPFGDLAAYNVEDQLADSDSTMRLVQEILKLRRRTPDLHSGAYTPLPAPDGVWLWRRGDRTFVALNFSDSQKTLPGIDGQVVVSTGRGSGGRSTAQSLALGPWEGAVVATK